MTTTRFTQSWDGIYRAYDEDGELLVAYGPDLIEDGEDQDEHWIGTLHGPDGPGATVDGTRAEVEAQARKWAR